MFDIECSVGLTLGMESLIWKYLTVYLLIGNLECRAHGNDYLTRLEPVIKYLNMNRLVMICDSSRDLAKTSRRAFKFLFAGKLEDFSSLSHDSAIVCAGDYQLSDLIWLFNRSPEAGVKNAWLVTYNSSQSPNAFEKLDLRIDQRIYFFDTLTGTLSESYVINGVRIKQEVGSLQKEER